MVLLPETYDGIEAVIGDLPGGACVEGCGVAYECGGGCCYDPGCNTGLFHSA
jgi:hypothetical protein